MTDFDPRARHVGQLHVARLLVKARHLIFDGAQRLEHLASQKGFSSLLRLGNCQHSAT